MRPDLYVLQIDFSSKRSRSFFSLIINLIKFWFLVFFKYYKCPLVYTGLQMFVIQLRVCFHFFQFKLVVFQ